MEDKIIKPIEEKQESVAEEKKEAPVEVVNDNPEAGKADPLLDGYYLTNPFFYDVANFFSIEPKDFDVAKDKLSMIVDYVTTEYGIKEADDVLLKIRELEDSITPPSWDEKRYNNLYKYIRLATKKQSIQKAMQAFQKNPAINEKQ